MTATAAIPRVDTMHPPYGRTFTAADWPSVPLDLTAGVYSGTRYPNNPPAQLWVHNGHASATQSLVLVDNRGQLYSVPLAAGATLELHCHPYAIHNTSGADLTVTALWHRSLTWEGY
jgi:hypothetical protein